MGLLRILTNRHVMGPDVFSATRAWAMFDAFLTDSRILRIGEPPGLDNHSAAELTLVTFDKQLASRTNVRTHLLG